LHYLVENALLGLSRFVAARDVPAADAVPIAKKECLGDHPAQRLPASYRRRER
jgi:hypothetical protein